MNFKILKAVAVAAATLLAAPVHAQQAQITESWPGGELNWDGPARTFLVWAPVISNGELLICGAYSNIGGTNITRLSRVVMQKTRVLENDAVILNTVSHFRDISNAHYQDRLVGQMANCQSTGLQRTQAQLSDLRLDVKTGRIRTP